MPAEHPSCGNVAMSRDMKRRRLRRGGGRQGL